MDASSSTIFKDPEDELLGFASHDEGRKGTDHAVRTAPVFTRAALDMVGEDILPQRALYGSIIAQRSSGFPETLEKKDAKLYINTNAPFSGVVCGVQGSGKSHSTSVLLEGCLMRDPRLGTLPAPLTGLVFHFDTAAGGGAVQPCEAAYLASLDPKCGGTATPPPVTILVVPNNLNRMREVYAPLSHVKVAPLHFATDDISGDRLLAMMKVESDAQMPLYVEMIMNILRSMEKFDYHAFRQRLDEESRTFNPSQKSMMKLRLSLLDACLKDGNVTNRVSSQFKPGRLTIIDLSSPFMDASSACSFFDIILGLFLEHRPKTLGISPSPPPKLVVLDEAHKYLTDHGSSSRLTESLLSIIRQQRHENMRVLISTQEPTVVPSKFLELCSFIIAHRFQSPQWFKHLSRHVAAAESLTDYWASKVISLSTGEAMFFAPAGLTVKLGDANDDEHATPDVAPIGVGYFLVRSRLRITRDGGQSFLAVPNDTDLPTTSICSEIATPEPPIQAPAITVQSTKSSSSTLPFSGLGESVWSKLATPSSSFAITPNKPTVALKLTLIQSTTPKSTTDLDIANLSDASSVASTNSTSVDESSTPAQSPDTVVPTKYHRLITFLISQHDAGHAEVPLPEIGIDRSKHPNLYADLVGKRLQDIMKAARDDGVIILRGAGQTLRACYDRTYDSTLAARSFPAAASSASECEDSDQDSDATSSSGESSAESSDAEDSSSDLHVPLKYRRLIGYLRERHAAGEPQVHFSSIGGDRSKNIRLYADLPAKITIAMEQMKLEGYVKLGGDPSNMWATLVEPSRRPVWPLPAHRVGKQDPRFAGLIAFLRESDTSRVLWSKIGAHRNKNLSLFSAASDGFKKFMEEAQQEGIILNGGEPAGREWAQLMI